MLKKLSLLLILLLCLSACVPVLIATVGATVGGAIIYDKRSTQAMLEDQQIANRASAALNSDPQLKDNARISVAVFNKVVLMIGQAKSTAARQRAYQDVRSVSEVKRVYNQVVISDQLSLMDASKDTWITSKVKTAMLMKKGLHSSQIKVVTENKVVYLMGVVTPKQAQLATDAARQVDGVQRVVQVFENEY